MKAKPLALIPGTLFWVFFVIALATRNDVVVAITVVLGVGTFVGFASAPLRTSAVSTRSRSASGQGVPATATVLTSRTNGSRTSINLDLGGHSVAVRQVIS